MGSSFLLIFSINIILPEVLDLHESQSVFNIITKYFCSLQKLSTQKLHALKQMSAIEDIHKICYNYEVYTN